MSTPSHYNLLELYRQHRDEIDAITDPLTLFILAYVNHLGTIRLDEIAGELGLSPAALNKTLLPLYRGNFITESAQVLSVTSLGKRVLAELGFGAPPVPPQPSEPPRQPPRSPAPSASRVPGMTMFGVAAVVLVSAILLGALALFGIFAFPALPPTRVPQVITHPPVTLARQTTVGMTPTFTPTPSLTWTLTPSRTPTWTRTFTPTRTPTPDTQGPPAPAVLAPTGGVVISCSGTYLLRWSSVTDPAGIARYEWVLEQSKSGANGPYTVSDSGETTSLTATPKLSCGWWYRWRVRAVDGLGNTGAYSAYAYFSIGID